MLTRIARAIIIVAMAAVIWLSQCIPVRSTIVIGAIVVAALCVAYHQPLGRSVFGRLDSEDW